MINLYKNNNIYKKHEVYLMNYKNKIYEVFFKFSFFGFFILLY